jgi:hypothetical protein
VIYEVIIQQCRYGFPRPRLAGMPLEPLKSFVEEFLGDGGSLPP